MMEEKELKNILKQSIKSPSAGFTSRVMEQIARQQELAAKTRRRIVALSVVSLLVVVLSLFVSLPAFSFRDISFEISPVVFPIIGVFFLVFEFNQLRDIHEKIRDLAGQA